MKKILCLLALLFPVAAHAQTAAYSGFCDQGATPATVSGLNSTNRLQGIIPYCTVTVYLDGVSQVSSATYTSGATITGTVGQTCNATFTGGTPSGSGSIALTGSNVIAGGTHFAITPPGVGEYSAAPTTATLTNGTASCSGSATVVTTLIPIKATIFKDSVGTSQTNPYQTLANGQILFYAATGQGYDIVKSGGIPPLTYITPLTVTDWIVPTGGGSGVVTQLIPGVGTTVTPGIGVGVVAVNVTPGATLDLEQYSVPVPNQGKLNVNSNIPTDPGLTPVLWKNDSLGDWLGEYQSPTTGGFGPALIPPRTDLASVMIYPSNGVANPSTQCGTGTGPQCYIVMPSGAACGVDYIPGPCSFTTLQGGAQNGVQIVRTGSALVNTNSVVWSNFTLPAGFTPSSVQYIYAVLIGGKTPSWGSPYQSALTVICGDGAGHTATVVNGAYVLPLTTYSVLMSGSPSTFNWSTATCTASNGESTTYRNDQYFNINQIMLIPYYAGTPSPASPGLIDLTGCLYYNPGPMLMGISWPCNFAPDTGTPNLMAVTIPALPSATPGMDFWTTPKYSNTTSNPTIIFNDSSPYTIVKCGGQALSTSPPDILAGFSEGPDAHFEIPTVDAAGDIELQNPTTGCGSGGGGGVSSMNSLTGALNIVAGSNITVTPSGSNITIASTGGGSGLSGMTASQVPIAATASTVTSSKALAGTGAGITTGPTTTTSGNCVEFTGTAGQIADNGSPCGSGGSGVPSVNGITSAVTIAAGTGITVGTAGSTVTVTATGGGGGQFAGKTIYVTGDQWSMISSTCHVSAITEGVISSGVVSGATTLTVTEAVSNNTAVGNIMTLSGFTGGYTALNGQIVTISSVGSFTQWTATVSGVSNGSTGAGYYACTNSLPQLMRNDTVYAGATIVAAQTGDGSLASFNTNFNTLFPSVTPNTSYIVAQYGTVDLDGGTLPSVFLADYQSVLAQAHTNNYKYIALTPYNTDQYIFTPQGVVYEQIGAEMLRYQNATASNAASGKYLDGLADTSAQMSDPDNPQYFEQEGCSSPCQPGLLNDSGMAKQEQAVSNAMATNVLISHKDFNTDVSFGTTSNDVIFAKFKAEEINAEDWDTLYTYLGTNQTQLQREEILYAPVYQYMSHNYDGSESNCYFAHGSVLMTQVDICEDRSLTLANTLVASQNHGDGASGGATGNRADFTHYSTNVTTNTLISNAETVNGPDNITGTETIIPAAPSQPALVLKGMGAGTQVVPVPGAHVSSYGTTTVPGPIPAGAMVMFGCLAGDGNTITDTMGATYTEIVHQGGGAAFAVFQALNVPGESTTDVVSGCTYKTTFDAYTGAVTTSAVDGTPSTATANPFTPSINTGNVTTADTGLLWTVMFTGAIGGTFNNPAPAGFVERTAGVGGGQYNSWTGDAPYTAGTYSANWNCGFLPPSTACAVAMVAIKGASQAADTGDHAQCQSSTGTLQCGITGIGDVFIINTSAGLILKDTVAGTCSRIQLTSGALVPTVVTCPN